MFRRSSSLITRLYDKQIDATGLALFRILYFTNLFFEVLQIFNFRHLIFDKIPFVEGNEIAVGIGLVVWLCVIVLLALGLFTRVSGILNYLLTIIFFGMAGEFAYHMYYLYTGINLLIMFLPVSRVISIDRLLTKLKYSSSRFRYEPPTTVSALSYLIPAMIGIGFVYYDSILYKLVSPYWLNGLGMWLPSSLPMIAHVDMSAILNLKFLMKFVGYLTLIFEFAFLFLFWHRKWRFPLFLIGIGLHLGILLEFPIPYFAIGVVALYILMVPVSFWKKIKFNRSGKRTLAFYFDAECPLCVRTVIVLKHFDIFRRIDFISVQSSLGKVPALSSYTEDQLLNDIHSVTKGGIVSKGYDTYRKAFSAMLWSLPLSWLMYLPGISHIGRAIYSYIAENRTNERCTDETCGYEPPVFPKNDNEFKLLHNLTLRKLKIFSIKILIGLAVFLQIAVSLNASLAKKVRHSGILKDTFLDGGVTSFSSDIKSVARPLLGITNHPVFMDFHFRNYNHIVAIVYKGKKSIEFLPVINENGQPGNYLKGGNFVNWTFKVNSADINQAKLSAGILRYTAFWAGSNGLTLKDLQFEIVVKKIDNYNDWEMNFLHDQLNAPWQIAGTAEWSDGVFSVNLSDIEKM